jgi:hypothetical protein
VMEILVSLHWAAKSSHWDFSWAFSFIGNCLLRPRIVLDEHCSLAFRFIGICSLRPQILLGEHFPTLCGEIIHTTAIGILELGPGGDVVTLIGYLVFLRGNDGL